MKRMDTGVKPVSPSLRKRSATLCLVSCCCLSQATAIDLDAQVFRASHRRTDLQTMPHMQALAPVVSQEQPFEPFGTPRYPDEQPELTWNDLAGHVRGKLGHVCEPGVDKQCGDQLVCRQEVCRHCMANRECPSLHHCLKTMDGDNICVPDAKKAWEKAGSDPYHFLCAFLIFFSSVLAAAAGTGGGGMFVPLLVLFAALKAEAAVPLSQCMIFFSSLCNIIAFGAQRHTTFRDQPKIDYDCIVLFEPMLVLGVTFGVLLHRMSPQWFLLFLLCITLVVALQRTAAKGLKQRNEEKELQSKGEPLATSPRERSLSWSAHPYFSKIMMITKPKCWHVIGISIIWLVMFAASFHGLSPCTWQFGAFFAVLAVVLTLCTFVALKCILTRPEESPKPLDWTRPSNNILGCSTYPAIAFGGGLLGGLLGLGGGVIMSPVLLEVGMHSESVQATTAVIVFLSSSLATIQFAILNQIVWHYALWYSCITIVATLLGQHLCEVYVRRTGRYSLITLSIAGVLLFSLIALAFVGTQQVVEDIQYGQQMWWSPARLCSGGRLGILDVDVMPAQAWPKDMPGDGLDK